MGRGGGESTRESAAATPRIPRQIQHGLPRWRRGAESGRGIKGALGPTTNPLHGLTVGSGATVSVMGIGVPITLDKCTVTGRRPTSCVSRRRQLSAATGPRPEQLPAEVGTHMERAGPDPARESREGRFLPHEDTRLVKKIYQAENPGGYGARPSGSVQIPRGCATSP